MLRDEIKPKDEHISMTIKQKEHISLEQKVQEFLAYGGQIQQVPIGASALDGGVLFVPECRGSTPITNTTKAFAKKGKKGAEVVAKNRSAIRQDSQAHITVRRNIRKNATGKYELVISAVYYGIFTELSEALKERQHRRELLGMDFCSEDK